MKQSLTIVTLACLLLLSQASVQAQNLVVNGGFETATVGLPGGTPLPSYPTTLNSWCAVTVDGEYCMDPTRAYAGVGFLSVLQNAGGNPGAPWLGAGVPGGYDRAAQVLNVAPSTQYTMSVWYRHGDGGRYGYTVGDMLVQVEQLSPTNAVIVSQQIPMPAAWTYYSINFTTGPAATQIIILYSCIGPGNADLWIDEASVIPSGCPLTLDLGNDTTICPGQTVFLDGTTPNATGYLWQNGSTNATLTATQPGTYWCEVTDGNCSVRDTIIINNFTIPTVNLGNDTTLCTGQTLLLNATNPNGIAYLWQDNSTNPTLNVNSAGTYWVGVFDGNCAGYDSIVVNYASPPTVSLGNDTTLCAGTTLTLNASNPGASYVWQDNSTNPTFQVTQQGAYQVTVSVGGCSATGTIQINYFPPLPTGFLADQQGCQGSPVQINMPFPADSYVWSTGATTDNISVSTGGSYWVEYQLAGCSNRDTMVVTLIPQPFVTLAEDILMCMEEVAILKPLIAQSDFSYFWSTGASGQQITTGTSGTYWIEASNGCGAARDSIDVLVRDCNCTFFLPNSFTANEDALNDSFRPAYQCDIRDYKLYIFNRWGEQVFFSDNPLKGWDGSYGSNNAPLGAYVYMMSYQPAYPLPDQPQEIVLRGLVNLIR